MTPYHTPSPHAAQTPRYGQQTPSQLTKSPFLHPGTVIGTPQQRTMASPYTSSQSVRNYSSQESNSWQKASEAWGAGGRTAPRQSPFPQQTQQPVRDHFGGQRGNFTSQRDNYNRRDNYGGRDNYQQRSNYNQGQYNNNRGSTGG